MTEYRNCPPNLPLKEHVLTRPQTLRGIVDYVGYFDLDEYETDRLFRGRVCDMGSGFDGLAASVSRTGLDCQVYSVNPLRAEPDFEKRRLDQFDSVGRMPTSEFFAWSDEEIAQALSAVDTRVSAAFAHEADYPDGYFDTMFDHYAVMFYSRDRMRDVYVESLKNMSRMVRPGGHLLIRDHHIANPYAFWYRSLLDGLGWYFEDYSVRGNYVKLRKPSGIIKST